MIYDNLTFICTFNFFPCSLAALSFSWQVQFKKQQIIKRDQITAAAFDWVVSGLSETNKEIAIKNNEISTMDMCITHPEMTIFQYASKIQELGIQPLYYEYCLYDCLSLQEILRKFYTTLKSVSQKLLPTWEMTQINDKLEDAIMTCKTLPSLSQKIYELCLLHDSNERVHKSYFKYPISHQQERDIAIASIIGGGSICNKPGRHMNVNAYDVVSLYPYVMKSESFLYPLDNFKFVNYTRLKLECLKDLHALGIGNLPLNKCPKVGFLHCVTIQFNTRLAFNCIPKRCENASYDWNAPQDINVWRTTVDIEQVLREGGTVYVDQAMLTDNVVTGSTIWGTYFEPISTMKKAQDVLKAAKSKDYNDPLRQCLKLMMNSLSGKSFQRQPQTTYTELTQEDLNSPTTKLIHTISCLNQPTRFFGTRVEQSARSPCWLGAFLLAHSRSYMMRFMMKLGKHNVISSETDSIYIQSKYVPIDWEEKYIGKALGQFEKEYANVNMISITKKFYCLYNEDKMLKSVAKGIPYSCRTFDLYEKLRNGIPVTNKYASFKRILNERTCGIAELLFAPDLERTIKPYHGKNRCLPTYN